METTTNGEPHDNSPSAAEGNVAQSPDSTAAVAPTPTVNGNGNASAQPEPQPRRRLQIRLGGRRSVPTASVFQVDNRGRVIGRNAVPLNVRRITETPPPQPSPTELPPLEPRPLQEPSDGSTSDESLERFRCAICFEFLEDPVRCSSEVCQSRFCHACLSRVIREASGEPKCPVCRVACNRLFRDVHLKEQMLGPTVPCRYSGCPQNQIPLASVRQHETACSFVPVACRYAPFGCSWRGVRSQVPHHEHTECALAKVSGLVEELRRLQMTHTHRLNTLTQQSAGTLQMLQVYRQTAQRDQMHSTNNILHLWDYCQSLTCSTAQFLENKHQWQSFFGSRESQGTITNTLVLVPTVGFALKIHLAGIRGIMEYAFSSAPNSLSSSAYQAEILRSIIALAIGPLAATLLVIHLVDGQSSRTWNLAVTPGVGKAGELLVLLNMWCLYMVIFEWLEHPLKVMFAWLLLGLVSTVFPSLVLIVSQWAARGVASSPDPASDDLPAQARTLQTAMWALKYAIVTHFFGLIPWIDVAVATSLIHDRLHSLAPSMLMKECSLENIHSMMPPVKDLQKYWVGIRLGFLVTHCSWEYGTGIEPLTLVLLDVLESILAFFMATMGTFTLNHYVELGKATGNALVKNAAERRVNLLGYVTFGLWVVLHAWLSQF